MIFSSCVTQYIPNRDGGYTKVQSLSAVGEILVTGVAYGVTSYFLHNDGYYYNGHQRLNYFTGYPSVNNYGYCTNYCSYAGNGHSHRYYRQPVYYYNNNHVDQYYQAVQRTSYRSYNNNYSHKNVKNSRSNTQSRRSPSATARRKN